MARATVTRFSDYLQRTFGLKGREDQQSVIGDVMPTIGLVDPTDSEHHFTRNEVLFSLVSSIAAGGAGQYGRIELTGRAGYITVIEAVAFLPVNSVAQCNVQLLASPGFSVVGGVTPVRLDSRSEIASPPASVVVAAGTTAGAVTPNVVAFTSASNQTVLMPLGLVIDGDDMVRIGTTVANIAVWFTVFGYEREASDWERA
jgi:hypothetical protein